MWSIPILLALLAGLWWMGTTPTPVSTATQNPTVVMPVSTPAEDHTTDVNALWQRYEALSQAAATAAAAAPSEEEAMSSSAVTPSPSQARSEAARQRQEARELIHQRRDAVMAARDDALSQIRNLDSSDVSGLLAVIENFNQQLSDSGVDEQIDMEGIRHQLVHSQRVADVSQAMLDEALKGESANPQRLQELSREMRALQQEVIGHP